MIATIKMTSQIEIWLSPEYAILSSQISECLIACFSRAMEFCLLTASFNQIFDRPESIFIGYPLHIL
jgi:hypothetical protein